MQYIEIGTAMPLEINGILHEKVRSLESIITHETLRFEFCCDHRKLGMGMVWVYMITPGFST